MQDLTPSTADEGESGAGDRERSRRRVRPGGAEEACDDDRGHERDLEDDPAATPRAERRKLSQA
jgi:hypothetical protein